MKGIVTLELFGEDLRQATKIIRGVFDLYGAREIFDKAIGVPPRSSWVAEITGPDEKYGLKREFVRAKLDYSRSNSKGSRGIFAEYILSSGKVYEVNSRVTWGRAERYFCIVDEETGDIIQIDEESACHSVGALTKDERREKRRAEKLS